MSDTLSIGMIGDHDPASPTHRAVVAALDHAADLLSIKLDVGWLPTESMLEPEALKDLERYAGLWASPGSPYKSLDGALRGIQYAREMDRPFLGT